MNEEATSWKEFFENFSYKPNWVFEFRPEVDFMLTDRVFITMHVPDSRKPLPEPTPLDLMMGKRTVVSMVPVSKNVILDPWDGEERAKDLLRWHIREMEDHEIDEWFRYKGELPFDPHKEK